MNIALAQINTTVGDIDGNCEKIIQTINKAKQQQADLIIFPELTTTSYPPKDLLLKKKVIAKNQECLKKIAKESSNISIIMGFIEPQDDKLYNAAALIENNTIRTIHRKMHLPNYDVFDEKRYFAAGESATIINIQGKKIGITICEDIWIMQGPATLLTRQGAQLIVNISASPFYAGKEKVRENIISQQAKDNHVPIIYVNQVGGQDDLIFDGGSYVFDAQGQIMAKARRFEEDFLMISDSLIFKETATQTHSRSSSTNYPSTDSSINSNPTNTNTDSNKSTNDTSEDELENIYHALVLGIKDYVRKNGFHKVVIGLSGGIDSALTACLAVAALGKENVMGVTMPSTFSSTGSVEDSRELAKNLGISFEIIPIAPMFDAYLKTLQEPFQGRPFNVAEENIQARIRGNILMALSNKFGYLVLSTGNKSEVSVGYATLYGDMAGGLSVISDLLKTKVYELSFFINKKALTEGTKGLIPHATLTKEPSAELHEGQKDTDSLPPYDQLDPILKGYVEEDLGKEELIEQGYSPAIVEKIVRMVDRNEYKRQQAAPGIKITLRAFGSGRRMPITNGWRE